MLVDWAAILLDEDEFKDVSRGVTPVSAENMQKQMAKYNIRNNISFLGVIIDPICLCLEDYLRLYGDDD